MAAFTSKLALPKVADALVVGGGPAGLATALTLARNVHTTIVFDSRSYRNARADHFHMLPTWDRKSPIDFRDAAKKNTLDNYGTVFYQDVTIQRAAKNGELFELTDQYGKVWQGRTLCLATGIIDIPVDILGFTECWGYSIASSGVLAMDDLTPIPIALHVARNAAQMTKTVTLYTHGHAALASELEAAAGPLAPFMVDSRRIAQFVLGPDRTGLTMHFEDGTAREEAFLAHKPKSKLKSDFLAQQLGLELTPQGDVKANGPFGETSLSGCFAAGDCASFLKTAPNAVNSDANSAAGLASHIQSRMYGQRSLSEAMQQMGK
ncbi:thioredoxin reductase glit [Apiospora rasikravindrae]|uniref:Thioredoxin reductase glit n=1 Tax=Apiospora rasikravindrae TaxID=990691 RepID=A0ABR1U9W4_9PEZI